MRLLRKDLQLGFLDHLQGYSFRLSQQDQHQHQQLWCIFHHPTEQKGQQRRHQIHIPQGEEALHKNI